MAAGNWVDWNTGDLVTAAAFQDIQDSIVFIFANESAANAALTNKVEGTIFYDTTDNLIKAWDGSAWISAESGDITAVNTASNSGLAGGATSGAVSLTLDPSNLSSGVTVDSANDLLILEDVTDGTVYKVTPDNLGIGGGGLVLLSSATASNSAELLFDNFVDTSTYVSYKLIIKDLSPVTDGVDLRFTFRTGGASGSDLSGTYYRFNAYSNITASGAESYTQTANTNFATVINLGNLDDETFNVSSDLFTAEGTYGSSFLISQGVFNDTSSTFYKVTITNAIDSVTSVTGIKWYFSSGNIDSGTILIYGVKK